VVAINSDPEAPIFRSAAYGVIGDLFQIVPRLTEEFRKLLSAARLPV
jgi:electron transfer flavoprotein alpha subunit